MKNQNQNKKQNQNKSKKQEKGNPFKGKKTVKVRKEPEGLYNVNKPLSEQGLKRAVQEELHLQIHPILKQTGRQIQELQAHQERDVNKASNLGLQATTNIGTYYKQLAAEEAKTLAEQKASGASTTGAVAQAGVDTLTGIKAAGTAAQTGIGGYEGQSISSRDRLAQMIAEQGATAGRENTALNAEAQENASGREALLREMAGAAQMRGGSQISDTHRQVLNQIGEIREKYGEALNKTQQARLEILEKRPELASKILTELREGERNFSLSKAALGLKKEEAESGGSGVKYAQVNARKNLQLTREKHKLRMQELATLGASEDEKREEEHRFREKELGLIKQQSKESGSGSHAAGWLPFNKAYSIGRDKIQHPGYLVKGIPKGKNTPGLTAKQARVHLHDQLVKNGATPKMAQKVIKKLIKQYNAKYVKLSKDPNGASLGR